MSDGLLIQSMQRIMSVLDEIDERKADIKEIYAEASGHGFDKAAIGVAIREIRGRAKSETPKAQERDSIVELYVAAFDNAPRTYVHVPARTREAKEHQPTRLSAERDPQSVQHGSDSEGGAGGDSPAFVAGSEQGSAEEPQARNEPVSEDIASGGAGATARPETPTRKPYVLRPHCLRPELCASYGSKHCSECERAAKASEDEEAAVVPAFMRKTHGHATGDQA